MAEQNRKMSEKKSLIIRIGLVLASVILGIAGCFKNGALVWFCFIPILFAAQGVSVKRAAKYGALAGALIGFFPALGLIRYGRWIVLAISAYGAFFGLLVGAAVGWVAQKPMRGLRILFLPMVWVALEFIRTLSPISLPSNLAISQHNNIYLLQIATLTGAYGISFVVVLVNCILFEFLRKPKLAFTWVYGHKTQSTLIVAIAVFILFVSLPVGIMGITAPSEEEEIKVAIVQGSIPIELYRAVNTEPEAKDLIRKRYLTLTDEAEIKGADLIVWPEGVLGEYAMQDRALAAQLKRIPRRAKAFFMAGLPSKSEDGSHNSAFIFSPRGEIIGQYDKVNLVPYFEEYKPGKRSPVVSTPLGKLGMAICFESIYPRIIRKLSKGEAEVLFILTNDAGFGNTNLVDFHAREAVFRAVENRRYVVRAAQSGISMVIDPMGRVTTQTEEFEKTVLTGSVWPQEGKTFYAKYGDVFAYLCILGSVAMFFSRKKER